MRSNRAKSAPARRGAVLAAVIVALIVASLVFGALLKAGSLERRLVRSQQDKQQAVALAESALERAAAQLAADAAYAGETWRLSPADVGGRDAGAVVIQVESVSGAPSRRHVTVAASYPQDSPRITQYSLSAVVDINRRRITP
jgi:Tfp pilus assembly protein PilX